MSRKRRAECWVADRAPFSPSYLGTLSGFCLWIVFVLFSCFGVEGTRIYFLQVFFDIKSLVDRQCLGHIMEVRWKACKLDMPCGHCLWVFLWLNDGMTK